jgi:signal transduction histidine kinase
MSTPTNMARNSAFDEEVEMAAARLVAEQTEVNEALVQRIFRYEYVEQALRVSERKLQALLAHQLSDREEERRRIALEIHDTLGQNLLALRLDVATLHEQTATYQSRLHGWVGAALDNLDGTILSARQLIDELRPFQLELGLQAALEWKLRHFSRDTGISCKSVGVDTLGDVAIDEAQVLTLYRALQEVLSNISRHAAATEVTVKVGIERAELTMRVADNGIGFDPAHPPAPAFGLMGMRERLVDAGGTCVLAPVAPHGTAVTITLPLFAQK